MQDRRLAGLNARFKPPANLRSFDALAVAAIGFRQRGEIRILQAGRRDPLRIVVSWCIRIVP